MGSGNHITKYKLHNCKMNHRVCVFVSFLINLYVFKANANAMSYLLKSVSKLCCAALALRNHLHLPSKTMQSNKITN